MSNKTEKRFYQIDLIDTRGRCHNQYTGNDKLLADKAWNRKIKQEQMLERIITDINPMGPMGWKAKLIARNLKEFKNAD